MNEVELINLAKKGNKSAMNTILNDNLGVIKGYVLKMTGDPHLSQDIIQETMLKAILNIDKFEPKAKFSTWMIRIATNVYRDYLRKNKIYDLTEVEIKEKYIDTEDMVMSRYEYKEIMNIVMNLSAEKRAVFILKHYYGYKYEEIAEILSCPVGTVRSRLHNAIKFIIKELERKEMI